jgi:hypothetical protein
MDNEDLIRRFAFHPANTETGPKHNRIRELCLILAADINGIVPEGREKSLAITKLEEVMMWSNAAIARNG